MSTFAPVYRPTKGQEAFLTREKKREAKKRKRQDDHDGSESDAPSTDDSSDSDIAKPYSVSGTAASVNRTDPYHVAGLSREQPLPRFPFPHAPVKSADTSKKSIQEELAAVRPPLFVPKTETGDQETSLKRRHLDNVTVILHRCMLKGDWERASRAWGLLARTELGGMGIDIRQHGRWGMGAEILMRREKIKTTANPAASARRGSEDDTSSVRSEIGDINSEQTTPRLSDEGFKLAREYYERLILQYPHTPHAQHTVNSKVFYPALFNIWVYEVQSRYKHRRTEGSRARRCSQYSIASDNDSDYGTSPRVSQSQDLTAAEIADATPIADRLDELLLSPPYDISEIGRAHV